MIRFKWETEFKQTEIGEVPREWEAKSIGQITKKAIVGSTPLRRIKEYWEKGTIPWLTNKEVQYNQINFIEDTEEKITPYALKRTNLKLIPPFSLIVSFTASVGKVAINKIPITTNQQFISFVLNNKEDVKFYAYYLLLSRELIESFSGATPFSFITKEKASQIPIPHPLPPEQSRIATVLSWFDDLIENKKRQNEILEKTAMAIFKSWFVDFEPFKDEEFVYSKELGKEIPKGWGVKAIGEVAEFVNGLSYKGSEKFDHYVDDSFVFITLNNIREGGGFKTEFAWIKSDRLKDRHFVKEGDLIFANTEQTKSGRLLATPAFIVFPDDYNNKDRGVYSHHITKVSPNIPCIKPLLYLMFRYYQENIAQTYHTGTGVWGFDLKNFKENFFTLIPPQPILQYFHSLVEPLFQKIILNQKQIMVLRKIRDALLPRLVFGKLRVVEI